VPTVDTYRWLFPFPDRPPVTESAGTLWLAATADHAETTLLRSADGGRSWTPRLSWGGDPIGIAAPEPDQVVVVMNLWREGSDGRGWPGALASSVDGGRSWRENRLPDGVTGQHHIFDPDNVLVAVHPGALARTEDGGRSWSTLPLPPGVSCHAIAFRTRTEGLVATPDGVYETRDAGRSWTHQPLSSPRRAGRRLFRAFWRPWFAGDGTCLLPMRAMVASERLVTQPAAAGLYLYRRAPGSVEWGPPARLPTTASWDFGELVAPDSTGGVWAASDRDLWVSRDGSWEHRPVPLPRGHQIMALAPGGGTTLWLVAGEPGTLACTLHRSDDAGLTWTVVPLRITEAS
jgi:hypothetical protein